MEHGLSQEIAWNGNSTGFNQSHHCKFNQVKVQNASSFQEKKKKKHLYSVFQ